MERPYLIWSVHDKAWYQPKAQGYAWTIAGAGVFTNRETEPGRERKIYLNEAYPEIMHRRGELIRDLAQLNAIEEALFGGTEKIRRVNVRNRSVEELEFSVRTSNCLRIEGIATIGELTAKSKKELLAMRHFGRRSLNEVVEVLDNLGLALREEGEINQ